MVRRDNLKLTHRCPHPFLYVINGVKCVQLISPTLYEIKEKLSTPLEKKKLVILIQYQQIVTATITILHIMPYYFCLNWMIISFT